MRLPRDISGKDLVNLLCRDWGYRRVHQVGSHIIQLALLHVGRNDEAGFFYYVMELTPPNISRPCDRCGGWILFGKSQ